MTAHAHALVAETAKEMAAVIFDEMMQSNDWYSAWKANHPNCKGPGALQQAFVSAKWPLYLDSARATLARLLETKISEQLKTQIHQALLMDRSLVRGRSH